MGGLEPFAVLLVSLLAARVLSSRMPSKGADDLQVHGVWAKIAARWLGCSAFPRVRRIGTG